MVSHQSVKLASERILGVQVPLLPPDNLIWLRAGMFNGGACKALTCGLDSHRSLQKLNMTNIRIDIDERKDEIINLLMRGTSRQEVCRVLQCKYDTLKTRLDRWGVLHLKNQSGKGNPKYGCRVDIQKHLVESSSIKSHTLKKLLWREELKPKYCE